MDQSSFSGSDDDTVIETDQPLFLDGVLPCATQNTCDKFEDTLGTCTEDDAAMAEFLEVTFDSNAVSCEPGAASSVEGVMDTKDMDELLMAENDVLMPFPDFELEN
mmetsp:Transcript_34206/g.80576  ORF Transcript_34206/g.80576 Transcript_34206/m.80576 type:complete len:106 (-) Transcript_34206:136-453(-)